MAKRRDVTIGQEKTNPILDNRFLKTRATNAKEILKHGVLALLFGESAPDYQESNDPDDQDEEFKEAEEEEEDDEIKDKYEEEKPFAGIKRIREFEKEDIPSKKKKLDNEEKNTVKSSVGPSISIITWNIEKFGKSTDKAVLQKKSETIGRILDQLQPMIMVMQEVTNAQMLIDGDDGIGLLGLKKTDVLDAHWKDALYPFRFQSGIKSLLHVLSKFKIKKNEPTNKKVNRLMEQLEKIDNDCIEEFIILINQTFELTLISRTLLDRNAFDLLLKDFIALLKTENETKLNKLKFKFLSLEPTLNPSKQYLFYPVSQIKQFHKKFNREDREEVLMNILDDLDEREQKLLSAPLRRNNRQNHKETTNQYYLRTFMSPYGNTYNTKEEQHFLKILMEKKFAVKDQYELSSEYAMLKGPRFVAGVELNTMSDFYPVFYNKSVIHTPPELSVYDLESGEMKTLDYQNYQHTFRYGKVTQEQVDETIEKLENELERLKTKLGKKTTRLTGVNNKLLLRLEKKLKKEVQVHQNLLKQQQKLNTQISRDEKDIEEVTFQLQVKSGLITEIATHKELKNRKIIQTDGLNLRRPFKKNRKLVLWKFRIPVNRYYMRPEISGLPPGSRNYHKYTEVYVGVVHTSPSLNIKKEITAIMQGAKKLSEATKIPILLGGDWYMQKAMKNEFHEMKDDENPDWVLIAPENNTNIPGLGKKGQIADHFMGKKGEVEEVAVRTIPPPSYTLGLSGETQNEWLKKRDATDYNQWRNITVDHTPVYSLVNIIFKNNIDNIEKMKITEIAGQFTKCKMFGDYVVLQEYVAKHDTGTFVEKGGVPTIQELGAAEYVIMTSTIAQEICPQSQGFPLIRLNTGELAYTQLLTGPKPTDGWSCAKGILELNDNRAVVTGNSSAEMHPEQSDNQGKMMNNACIYALNITKGFGIILAAKDSDQWHASVGCNATMTISDDKLEAMKFDQIQAPSNYYAVIAINCLFKNDTLDASIAVLLNQLETMGVFSQQVTIYKSYATYENIAVSIGINAFGCWGEVLDQNQDPNRIWT